MGLGDSRRGMRRIPVLRRAGGGASLVGVYLLVGLRG